MQLTLPSEIRYSKKILPAGRISYVFWYKNLGELGRLIIKPNGDRCPFVCDIAGDPDDPMTEKRGDIIEHILKGLSLKISNLVDDYCISNKNSW